MTHEERQKLDDVHQGIDFIINRITVNGNDGSSPVIGLQSILEAHHKNDKIQNKKIEELMSATVSIRARKKIEESFHDLIEASPIFKFFLKLNKVKIWIVIAIIILITEILGFNVITNSLKDLLKLLRIL